MAGLYLHIPFCESRCIYCGFFSSTLLKERQAYVDALCRELALRRNELGGEVVETIYLGGGTPSMLTPPQLQQLFAAIGEHYRVAPGAEVTMECNPDDVTEDFCEALSGLPVNRVSMGAQTFSDARLRFLHRRHQSADVAKAVECLRRVGVQNISIDLMFGFPGETLAEWTADIDAALALGVEHLSAYSLMYEEGTALYRLLEEGRVEEIDEELYRQMYDRLIDRLTAAGYEHYEISNFAKPARRSRHNSSYWTGAPYMGIGAAAHSYDRNTRSWNVADLNQYIKAIGEGRLPLERETLDEATRYDDLIVTALRTREGIDLTALPEKQAQYLQKQAAKFLQCDYLRIENSRITLTRQGIYVSDAIMADLMWEE